MLSSPHIVLAGGGSLGHIYPGLAIAEELLARTPGARVTFVGDGRAVERDTVRAAGYEYRSIPCRPRPARPIDGFRFVTDNAVGLVASRWLLRETRASLVLGLGGAASAPLLRAGHSCGLPLVIMEQNAWPSMTSRWLASRADSVCLGFDDARARLPVAARTVVTGTPGRPAFARLRAHTGPRLAAASTEARRLVVIGGVGGATSLNASVPQALARCTPAIEGWTVVHQAGEGQLVATERRYRQAGVEAVVVAFIDELADLLSSTDVVVCRAGGCTLAELALAGVPAVVTPDSRHAQRPQIENARVVERHGACEVVDESDGDLVANLARSITRLADEDRLRRRRGEAMASLARPDAAAAVAEACRRALGLAASPNPRRAAAA